MATMPLLPDFKEFLRLLNDRGVEYLLIGGYAVAYHGHPRATRDMDVWIALSRENAARMVAVLQEFGFDLPENQPELFLDKRTVVRMGIPPQQIDISTDIDGVQFAACYARRVVFEVDGLPVNLISLEDLKANKRASGRLQDLADVEKLP